MKSVILQKSLAEKAKQLFINLKISESQCREIERVTREQINCTERRQQWKGHITASNFHDILTAKNIHTFLHWGVCLIMCVSHPWKQNCAHTGWFDDM